MIELIWVVRIIEVYFPPTITSVQAQSLFYFILFCKTFTVCWQLHFELE